MEADFLEINLVTNCLAGMELVDLIKLLDLIGWIPAIYAAGLVLNLINKDLIDLIDSALTEPIKVGIKFVEVDWIGLACEEDVMCLNNFLFNLKDRLQALQVRREKLVE